MGKERVTRCVDLAHTLEEINARCKVEQLTDAEKKGMRLAVRCVLEGACNATYAHTMTFAAYDHGRCTQCGVEIEPRWKWCPLCGSLLDGKIQMSLSDKAIKLQVQYRQLIEKLGGNENADHQSIGEADGD